MLCLKLNFLHKPVKATQLSLSFAFLCLMALISACASTPESRFYVLSETDLKLAEMQSDTENLVSLVAVIGPFRMPGYLQRPQIVTRSDETNLVVAEYDRWSEPMKTAFSRVLSSNVGNLSQSPYIFEFPASQVEGQYCQASGVVKRFDVDEKGVEHTWW